jgi:hypothetical protein
MIAETNTGITTVLETRLQKHSQHLMIIVMDVGHLLNVHLILDIVIHRLHSGKHYCMCNQDTVCTLQVCWDLIPSNDFLGRKMAKIMKLLCQNNGSIRT